MEAWDKLRASCPPELFQWIELEGEGVTSPRTLEVLLEEGRHPFVIQQLLADYSNRLMAMQYGPDHPNVTQRTRLWYKQWQKRQKELNTDA